ncbi:MAG: hypothetical protein GX282_00465 [Campylobacteraceae bacterium]|nr:hypothetical protein [Campylobacteraceae bacterium]
MNLKQIDLHIGQALNSLELVASELKQNEELKEISKNLALLIPQIWEERENLYSKFPEIKVDFLKKIEENKEEFIKMDTLLKEATKFEEDGELKKANETYKKLLEIADISYFKLQAEAGAFRTQAK